MDASADAGALSLLRDAARREVAVDRTQRDRNLRTGLVLASIALAFFVGIIMKYWMMSS
jgi:hypothetical protein